MPRPFFCKRLFREPFRSKRRRWLTTKSRRREKAPSYPSNGRPFRSSSQPRPIAGASSRKAAGQYYPSSRPTILTLFLSKQRKSVQFADGVRPGEGTSPSGGEELSSPPPRKLPKEKRYKKIKIPKKSKKKKVRVKVVKKAPVEEEEDDDEEDNLPPPSPPPGSPPPHIFPSRVKTHTINNVHQYVGNIIQSTAPGFPFRSPMPPMVMNRHQPPPGYMPGAFPTGNFDDFHRFNVEPSVLDVGGLSHSHPTYQGVSSHH